MTKDSWTAEQDEILAGLANKTWANRKALLEEISTNIPNIDPVKALYHAVQHNKVKYDFVPRTLTGEALTDAQDLLREGYDSTAVQKEISLKHGILLSTNYYNSLRFKTRRGEYVLVKHPTKSGQFVFEHRLKVEQNLKATQPKATATKVTAQMRDKWVTHPSTLKVDENEYKNLYMCTPAEANKIAQINFVASVLGLDFGQLMEHVDATDLATKTPKRILSELFEDAGLSDLAFTLFDKSVKEA